LPFLAEAQAPSGYYDGTSILTGYALKSKLHQIISEKNITTKNLENSNEIIANGKITSDNIDNKDFIENIHKILTSPSRKGYLTDIRSNGTTIINFLHSVIKHE